MENEGDGRINRYVERLAQKGEEIMEQDSIEQNDPMISQFEKAAGDMNGVNWAEEQIFDDISGKQLNNSEVLRARMEEMEEIRKHGVYKKVPIEKCREKTGKEPISVRWVDVNKGDDVNTEIRSRLVAKEIKRDNRDDLFAATPPLEAKKALFSLAVTEGVGFNGGAA